MFLIDVDSSAVSPALCPFSAVFIEEWVREYPTFFLESRGEVIKSWDENAFKTALTLLSVTFGLSCGS